MADNCDTKAPARGTGYQLRTYQFSIPLVEEIFIPREIHAEIIEGVPFGATLVDAGIRDYGRVLELTFQHPSFPPVEGIPPVHAIVVRSLPCGATTKTS